jgi:hypothetical protein
MPLNLQKAAKPQAAKKTAISLTVTKAKGVISLSNQKGVLAGYESIVDQLAALGEIITPEVQAALKKQKRFQDELRAIADKETPADAKATITGTTHDFVVTERGEQRTVIVQEARKQLGEKLFIEVAKVLLNDIDKYLTPDQQKACVAFSRTGPRKGSLVAK